MLELTAKIILIGGLLGMGFMIFRKTPALRELPEIRMKLPEKKGEVLNRIRFKISSFLRNFWLKIKNLKGEKDKEEKSHLSDDYWEKIRKG